MPSKKPTNVPAPAAPSVFVAELPPELKRLHELCKLYAIADRELGRENAALKREVAALVGRHADYMVEMTEAKQRTHAGIEELIRQNLAWLGEKRSLKTPHGVASLRSTTSLVIADEAETLKRLRRRAKRLKGFNARPFIKVDLSIRKEVLEKLDDEVLTELGVVRLVEDKFNFKLVAAFLEELLADAIPNQQERAAA